MIKIGTQIRQIRQHLGLTEHQLEARSGIARSYLCRIQHDQISPSLRTCERICNGLNISLPDLLNPRFLDGEELYMELIKARRMLSIAAFGYIVNEIEMRSNSR